MEATQFRQIVMLAQGEFKAFMEAKDNDRKDILAKLFDSSAARILQDALATSAKQLTAQLQELQRDMDAFLKPAAFYLPEDISDEERVLYHPAAPHLAENIARLIAQEEAQQQALLEAKQMQSAALLALTRRQTEAEAMNKRIAELAKETEALAQLLLRQEEIDRLQQETAQSAVALRQVQPAKALAQAAQQRHERAAQTAAQAEARITRAGNNAIAAQKAAAGNEQRAAQKALLDKRIADMTDAVEAMAARDKEAAAKTTLEKTLAAKQTALTKAEADLKALTALTDEAARQLLPLQDIDALQAQADSEYKAAQKEYDELTHPATGLPAVIAGIRKAMATYEQGKQKAAMVQAEALRLEEAAHALHMQYIDGYAFTLQKELDHALDTCGEADCPVCGTRFSAASRPKAAVHAQTEIPTKEALTKADEDAKAGTDRLNKAREWLITQQSSIEERTAALLQSANTLLPAPAPWSWETLTSSKLTEAIGTKLEAMDAAGALARKRNEEVKQRNRLKNQLEEYRLGSQNAIEQQSALGIETATLAGEIKAAQARIEAMDAQLNKAQLKDCATAEAAQAEIRRLTQESAALAAEIDRTARQLEESQKEKAAAEEGLKSAALLLAETAAEKDKTAAAYLQALSAAGFAAEEDFLAAMARITLPDGEAWIARNSDRIQQYAALCTEKQQTIARLQKETEGHAVTDLTALSAEADALTRQIADTDAALTTLTHHISGHRTALDKQREGQEEKQLLARAQSRMQALGDMACGRINNENGRHAFEGFVLSCTFREVLRHASGYLYTMTGGKYVLEHDRETAGAHRNSAADFRILVTDNLTGQQREIGSLSGGESFQASMALALGLSDTVQNHSGTVKIESMFIDEGFGTLDSDCLDRMLKVLSDLSGGKRQIGIISHVDELSSQIQKGIRVSGSKDSSGSRLHVEYDG
ncbi:MAG: SbcC/MukB-like Walker B domain-containing protein [Clostridia bacterium]|nr:SbcC/MukB-like Walker B domain-containing protein [Clostridia bacterium]